MQGEATLAAQLSALGGSGSVARSSPLGSAIFGKRPGDTVEVSAPGGSWRATIAEIRSDG